MTPTDKLSAIKVLHTAIWAVMAAAGEVKSWRASSGRHSGTAGVETRGRRSDVGVWSGQVLASFA